MLTHRDLHVIYSVDIIPIHAIVIDVNGDNHAL
jgi:hypothetical protein